MESPAVLGTGIGAVALQRTAQAVVKIAHLTFEVRNHGHLRRLGSTIEPDPQTRPAFAVTSSRSRDMIVVLQRRNDGRRGLAGV